jgi:hypothetical protein
LRFEFTAPLQGVVAIDGKVFGGRSFERSRGKLALYMTSA